MPLCLALLVIPLSRSGYACYLCYPPVTARSVMKERERESKKIHVTFMNIGKLEGNLPGYCRDLKNSNRLDEKKHRATEIVTVPPQPQDYLRNTNCS